MTLARLTRIGLFLFLLLIPTGAGATGAAAQDGNSVELPSTPLNYRDNDGEGSAVITSVGPDSASGGVRIAVTITQNGRTFQGQGFARQLAGPPNFVIAFWLPDGAGDAYVFTGTLIRGFAGWSGQGRYERVSNPSAGDQWTISTPPCIVC